MIPRNQIPLPPAVQKVVEEYAPKLRALGQQVGGLLGPLWEDIKPQLKALWASLKPAGSTESMGRHFRHVCVVGLNKAELLMQGETQAVMNESWLDLADETLKKNLALVFFAPRGLDGQPVSPAQFLMNEAIDETVTASSALPPALHGMALMDFCRLPPAAPNTVNIMLAADILFHWDTKDNYVLPTTATGWVRDVETVLRSYPRTTRVNIYTQWDVTLLTPSERISTYSLRELPLESAAWLNEPTMQEKYGMHILAGGLVVAGLVWAGLWHQEKGLQTLTDELNMVQQQIPRGGQFSDLEKALKEQEDMFARRPLFALAVKDMARSVTASGFKAEQLELRVPDANAVPNAYLMTVTAEPEAYAGWLQQEPAARAFLLNSALISAVRKPPSTTGFKLEGLVQLVPVLKEYKRVAPQLPASVAPALMAVSSTEAKPADAEEEGAQ